MTGAKTAKDVSAATAATALIAEAVARVTVTGAKTAKDVPIPAATVAPVSTAAPVARVTVTGVMTARCAVTVTNAARGK